MKKIILIATAALVSLSGFAQQKFAHVTLAEIVQLMPETDKALETLAISQKEAQDTYQGMVNEFQDKYKKYEQLAATKPQTDPIRQAKEKELSDLQARIQEFGESIQGELAQQEQNLMAPIMEKASKAVAEVAKAGGYIFVFGTPTLLYVDPAQSKDITNEVRTALNIPADRTLESVQAARQAKAQEIAGGTTK